MVWHLKDSIQSHVTVFICKIHGVSKETNHFFRVTLSKIHIKINHTVPPGNNFPIIPEYSQIFPIFTNITNIHKYSHIFWSIF